MEQVSDVMRSWRLAVRYILSAITTTHHLHPKPMRAWQKRTFTQNDANAKNAIALGVKVNAILLFGFLITFVKEEYGLATSFGQ